MKNIRNVLITNGCLLLLYLFTSLVSFLVNAFSHSLFTNVLFIILSILFITYVGYHIGNAGQKHYLMCIAVMIFLFMMLRALKYGAFRNVDVMARHLWYAYYVPILFIPYFLFDLAVKLGKERDKKDNVILWGTGIVTSVLAVLVMTNDMHRTAFAFRPNFENWDGDYSHGILYVIVVVWVAALLIASFAVLIKKCRISVGKKYFWIAFLPIILGIVWTGMDILDVLPMVNGHNVGNEFPETFCFMIVGFILSCVKIGLIPANDQYASLLKQTSIPAHISDYNGKVVYKSISSVKMPENLMPKAGNSITVDDSVVRTISIPGGTVTWCEDISELNRLNESLSEIHDKLTEENELHQLRNRLKEENLSLDEKNKLYDTIARAVRPQSEQIARLAEEAEKTPALFSHNMAHACFLNCFIKRYANLTLIARENENIHVAELELAVAESLRYLKNMGVVTVVVGFSETQMVAKGLICAYKIIENTLEENLSYLRGVQAIFYQTGNVLCRIVMEGANFARIEKLDRPHKGGIVCAVSGDEDMSYLDIILAKEAT